MQTYLSAIPMYLMYVGLSWRRLGLWSDSECPFIPECSASAAVVCVCVCVEVCFSMDRVSLSLAQLAYVCESVCRGGIRWNGMAVRRSWGTLCTLSLRSRAHHGMHR